MDVTVIIRSSNERTERLCQELAGKQVGRSDIFTIQERPFSKAVKRTFELGLEKDKKWTLALDADILLSNEAISSMVLNAEKLPENFFEFQGRVLDKFFGVPRPGGPHLYRTQYLREALELANSYNEELRPESWVFKKMADNGYHYFHSEEIYGIHDYGQFYTDIFRKCFVQAQKHSPLVPNLIRHWSSRNDLDYSVAFQGLFEGLRYKGKVIIDSGMLKDEAQRVLNYLKLQEKQELDPGKSDLLPVNNRIEQYFPDKSSLKFEQSLIKFLGRSDGKVERTIHKNGKIGTFLVKAGYKLKEAGI